MQKSYVFTDTVNFSLHDFYSAPGDQGVYDAQAQTITVYRGGNLLKTFSLPSSSVTSMVERRWLVPEGVSEPLAVSKPSEFPEGVSEEERFSLTDDIVVNPTPGFEGIEVAETPGDMVIDETPDPEPVLLESPKVTETIQVFSDDDPDVEVMVDEPPVVAPKVKKPKKAKQ